MSDKVHQEAHELAEQCVRKWLGREAGNGADLEQLKDAGYADPVPYITEAIAAAITGRDPDWHAVESEASPEEITASLGS